MRRIFRCVAPPSPGIFLYPFLLLVAFVVWHQPWTALAQEATWPVRENLEWKAGCPHVRLHAGASKLLAEERGVRIDASFEEAKSGIAQAVDSPKRMPAEFEKQGMLLIGSKELAHGYPALFAQMVYELGPQLDLVMLLENRAEQKDVRSILEQYRVSSSLIHFLEVRVNTMWIRDYGPFSVEQPSGEIEFVDADYSAESRTLDNEVAWHLSVPLGKKAKSSSLVLDGGNVLGNGRGLILTSNATLDLNATFPGRQDCLGWKLKFELGGRQIVFLDPLVGEGTRHVDMFAVFTAIDQVVVGEMNPERDPVNAAILDQNAARLGGLPTPVGPLRVVRIPMPPCKGPIFRTYTNVVFANGVLLVPVYPDIHDTEGERGALATYRRLLPGWRIVPVDASCLIQLGGALRCVSLNVPMDSWGRTEHKPERPSWPMPWNGRLDVPWMRTMIPERGEDVYPEGSVEAPLNQPLDVERLR